MINPSSQKLSRCMSGMLTCFLIAAGSLSCSPSNDTTQTPDQTTPVIPELTSVPPSTQVLVATQVIADAPTRVSEAENTQPTLMPAITRDPNDILNLTFPTPRPMPISSWRPPLYSPPWALGPHDHFFFARPIAADTVNWPLKDYRYGGIFFGPNIVHTGIDIPNPKGTPVLAAGPGKVIWTGYGVFYGSNDPRDPYGLAVSIQHDFGYQGRQLYTIYAHMDRIDVVRGQRVDTGTQLGVVGETGNTTGPHLHFEVRIESNSFYSTRNPELWLVPPSGWGVLVGRMMNTNTSLLTRTDLGVKSLTTGRKWTVTSYGSDTVISDDYYRENVVLSDLPAGDYELSLNYLDKPMVTTVTIHPGAITYFTFRGNYGFSDALPPTPSPSSWLKPFSP
jgi:murein DD-endopeptidase MepM/ murein hydrolase activator NlpD